MYIRSVKLNGKMMPNNFIRYSDISNGGKLEIYLNDQPGDNWAVKPLNQPKGM